jgi:tetratricopeptide (TPR) repeat protein
MLIITTIQLPSMFFIIFKIILWDNVVAPSLDRGAMVSNVGYSAHLGGYTFGLVVALAMLALRGLPRTQFDLLALWSRWHRRSGMTGEMSLGGRRPARTIVVEEMESRPLEPLKLTPLERLREDILDRISEHDLDEAVRLYQQLLESDPHHVLPRTQQLEIGNRLAQLQRYDAALRAYDGFLGAYPTARDAAQVRLYAGLICRRYLHDSRRAIAYLRAALEGLTLESQRQLAAREMQAAEADISGPSPGSRDE